MITFLLVVVGYTMIWICGIYFMLHRLHTIRKRTERRMHDYDREYIMPAYRSPWIYTIILGLSSYMISLVVIFLFLKPY